MDIEEHFEMLGKPARDKVTGFQGVITSLSFDLYGCVQAVITPAVDKEGKPQEGSWMDVTRLEILKDEAVMQLPEFDKGYVATGQKGCSEKPLP